MEKPIIAAKQPAVLTLDAAPTIGVDAGAQRTSPFATDRTMAPA